jgi:glycosyltransferase involved in cell wall biosynthesis
MLSILIPIYNEDVTTLVTELVRQARAESLDFEILCFDDASPQINFHIQNEKLNQIPEVNYQRMSENRGRSKIRNILADSAKGEYLLFMDGDSKVVRNTYLRDYWLVRNENTLLYGGRCYDNAAPAQVELLFHWRYGKAREQQSVAQRSRQPYHSFMTNNFMIPAALFHQIRFDESLKQYGHEDTLFGMALKAKAIPIVHLDNPLEHAGLEHASVFLEKTKKAIENLHQLQREGKKVETKLSFIADRLQGMGLGFLFLSLFNLLERRIYNNLLTGSSSMRLFDFYKLGLLLRMMG